MSTASTDWSDDVFAAMKARSIVTVCTIPDGGLTRLLRRVEADGGMRLVTLTTEEEGIALAAGADWTRWETGALPAVALAIGGPWLGHAVAAVVEQRGRRSGRHGDRHPHVPRQFPRPLSFGGRL